MHVRVPLGTFFIFCVATFGVQAEVAWRTYPQRHFVIYTKDVPQDFVERVKERASEYYQEIIDRLGFIGYRGSLESERIKIYIYKNAEEYLEGTRQAHWSHGSASVRSREIQTFPAAHGFFDSTLPHELGHIIFRDRIGLEAEVPLCFEEGVAMYQELARRWGAREVIQAAMAQGQFIPFAELIQMRLSQQTPRAIVELFYAESADFIHFLMNAYGQYKFVHLCRKLKEGVGFLEAVDSVYGRDIERIGKAWEISLSDKESSR